MGRATQEYIPLGDGGQVAERRRFERYQIKIPAMVECIVPEGSRTLFVETVNISAQGVYLPIVKKMSAARNLRMNFILEFSESDSPDQAAQILIITVTGNVLRTEDEGMAVAFDGNYKIRTVQAPQRISKSNLH